MDRNAIIFSKTAKGREEMSTRCHGLNPLQRRVLIFIDGSREVGTVTGMIAPALPAAQLGEILDLLVEQNFITPASARGSGAAVPEAAPPAVALPPAAPSFSPEYVPPPVTAAATGSEFTDNATTIRQVKDFMTTTAQTYLGLLSAPVIQRIEQAHSAAQLMTVAAQWNMALRDSQQGKRFASPYMEQVKAALTASAAQVTG